mgnify:CR=1 FL=1
MGDLRILFISHTYPPIVGGVENQNYELYTWLSKITEVKLVANKKRWLIPFFLPYVSVKTLFLAKNYDVVLLGSCILGNVSWLMKKLSKKPIIAVAHGLDLTWKNKIYQKIWVDIFIPSLDKIIAVGNETVQVAIKKGIKPEKIVFIPNGVSTDKKTKKFTREDLEKALDEKLEGKKIILTSGRLAKRKGVAWFIENVLPKLPENIVYIVAGNGPDKNNIRETINKNNLSSRVKMLGYVSNEIRDMLFSTCDLFVQPNIKVPGDMEGFGISVIEAALNRLPVIAAAIEGLKDAIKDGENGFLVESGNAEAWKGKIEEILSDDEARKAFGQKARQFVIENYSWEKISRNYLEEITKLIK